jgi:hypothetical protein
MKDGTTPSGTTHGKDVPVRPGGAADQTTGTSAPSVIKGSSRTPVQGASPACTFDDAAAPSRTSTQHDFACDFPCGT